MTGLVVPKSAKVTQTELTSYSRRVADGKVSHKEDQSYVSRSFKRTAFAMTQVSTMVAVSGQKSWVFLLFLLQQLIVNEEKVMTQSDWCDGCPVTQRHTHTLRDRQDRQKY